MNSSISSSSARRGVLLFFATVVLAMVALDVALDTYVRRNTTASRFIDESRSKAAHMRLHLHGAVPDMVVVGSSNTMYHISTQAFAEAGLTVYNLGVAGQDLVNYPSLVADAAATGTRVVALGLTAGVFFLDQLSYARISDLRDLRALWAVDAPWNIRWLGVKDSVRRMHSLLVYSNPMYIRLRQLCARFDAPGPAGAAAAPVPDGGAAAPDAPGAPGGAPVIPARVDCDIFDVNRVSPYKTVTKCTNGDGIIFGSLPPQAVPPGSVKAGALNRDYVRLLAYCIDIIRRAGSQPLVVLYPGGGRVDEAGLAAIRAAVAAPVIDDSGYDPSPDMWADSAHLNYHGRLRYSRRLAAEILAVPDLIVKDIGK
ncbi:MAG: hypothetical protein AB7E47_05700 [Desulfovibrionaceae bacterium]